MLDRMGVAAEKIATARARWWNWPERRGMRVALKIPAARIRVAVYAAVIVAQSACAAPIPFPARDFPTLNSSHCLILAGRI